MIRHNQDEETYEELMRRNLAQIPVYSKEWTNYNSSDPGITLLENMTAFQLVQQKQINTVTDAVRRKLLKLAGYEPKEGRCAKVLLSSKEPGQAYRMPAGQKLFVGELCYETSRAVTSKGSRLIGMYAETGQGLKDLSNLLQQDASISQTVFGEEPAIGQSLYLVVDSMPKSGEEWILYVRMQGTDCRNISSRGWQNELAQIEWSYYTGQGFVKLPGKDETKGLLVSGALYFSMPEQVPAVYEKLPVAGYVLRGTLIKADYDIAPCMNRLSGFLFEAWQKETKAACISFQISTRIDVYSSLLDEGYYRIYCREKKGEGYRLYKEAPSQKQEGRFVRINKEGPGHYCFCFCKRRYHYGPARLKNAIKIVAYQESMMRGYYLDRVLGYDNQVIDLPVRQIIADSFCLIAERIDEQGEAYFDFVKPDYRQPQALVYTLDSVEGKIIIRDAGAFLEARLYIGSLSVSSGENGNVREWNEFIPHGETEGIRYTNPCAGEGGRLYETTQELADRFYLEQKEPAVAVTAQDYEMFAKNTPGLCIHKVKAVMDTLKNRVDIFVKPYSKQPHPVLSDTYRKAILKQLEGRRLLTTRIEVQGPVYLPIHVSGTVYGKAHYEGCQQEVEQLLYELLEGRHNNRNFGDVIRFDEIYGAVERLECVAYIENLHMRPQYFELAALRGQDIIPKVQCLCCAGQITVKTESMI